MSLATAKNNIEKLRYWKSGNRKQGGAHSVGNIECAAVVFSINLLGT